MTAKAKKTTTKTAEKKTAPAAKAAKTTKAAKPAKAAAKVTKTAAAKPKAEKATKAVKAPKAEKAAKAAKVEAVKAAPVVIKKTTRKKSDAPKNMRWYVVQSQSNYEKRVQAAIREQALIQELDDEIEEVLIPTEEVVEVKKGIKSQSERKLFPGYVLVKCNMTDEIWHLIKGISKVTGFVGANKGNKPLPISETEAKRILQQMEEGVEKPRPLIAFEVGEEIRVVDGPFQSFQGVVEEIDEDRSRLKVSVSIFGRATPIDLDYSQVEKA